MQDEEIQKDELKESLDEALESDIESDVEFEDSDEEGTVHSKDTIKKLREKLKTTEAEKMEYLTGWQRAKADFINLRKKDEEVKGEFMKFANEGFITDILPVLDSFDLAIKNKTVWESLPEDWRKGMESIYTQLVTILGNHGVTKLDLLGKHFDPSNAEAVSMQKVDTKDADQTVVSVLQSGFSMSGRTIRTAKVIVGEYHE